MLGELSNAQDCAEVRPTQQLEIQNFTKTHGSNISILGPYIRALK